MLCSSAGSFRKGLEKVLSPGGNGGLAVLREV